MHPVGAQGRTVEEKLARMASRTYGVVTWEEMLRAGISRREIEHRVRIGSLIRVHRRVYRVGHYAPSMEARYLAAVRACGDGALLCGPAAGHLYRLLKWRPRRPEVMAPKERRVRGVKTRRCRHIHPTDVTSYRGIPVTTIPRTLVDMAPDLTLEELAWAFHQAGLLHHVKPSHVEAVLARRPNAPGAAKLRMVIHGDAPAILSELERGFRKLMRDANLPLPIMNRPAGAHWVDCRWEDPPVTIELDSYRFHNSRYAWKQDHLRARAARKRGDFRRYIWEDVFEAGEATAREVGELLERLAKGPEP
jgi:hypothetical protein